MLKSIQKISAAVLVLALASLLVPAMARAESAPVVSNVQAVQRSDSYIVDITYDVADLDGDFLWVSAFFSPDGGATWPTRCAAVSGDVGLGVPPGIGRSLQWDARQDLPGETLSSCSIRIVASDESPWPRFEYFWHVADGDSVAFAPGVSDTIGFGQPFRLGWQAVAPSVAGLDAMMLAAFDSVFPFDDGLMGYKYDLPFDNCVPLIADCWRPRWYDSASGDSVSYFGAVQSLSFSNDNTGTDPLSMLLPSGSLPLKVNAVDVNGFEIAEYLQSMSVVVNFDPETIILNGEQDWAHPSDSEVYPYYIRLDDPAQVHQPFVAGDRIPDRTYVVVKALGRDDARDRIQDPSHQVSVTGYLEGLRDNTFGGQFSFQTDSSLPGESPTWAAGVDGWSADTLGFLTGPSTEFTINMQATDEHGRRDGTPASLSFDVGYPPCVQCVEVLPKSSMLSAWNDDLECVDDPASHPCFQQTPEMRISLSGAGDDDLEYFQASYMLVNKQTHLVEVTDDIVGQELDHYVIPARLYRMSVLLHGMDDPRESWAENLRRMMAWRYQVDYDCDPFNLIKDGGGNDDLLVPTLGEPADGVGLDIDPATGLWRLQVEVAVPDLLFNGPDQYLLLLTFLHADNDPELAQAIFDATTRQFGDGTIRAIAMDQTDCGILPPRPARYHYFSGVRPSVSSLPAGQTWRDCNLFVPGIKGSLTLKNGSMFSNGGAPVVRPFRLIVETSAGDFACSGP